MIKLQLKNNLKTTLVSTVSSSGNIPVSSLASDVFTRFNEFDYTYQRVTLTNADESLREIIDISYYDSGTSTYMIERGKEGTLPLTWPAGTKVEMRITKGILEDFGVRDVDSTNSTDVGRKGVLTNNVFKEFFSGTDRVNSSAVLKDQRRKTAVADRLVIYHSDGTTGASAPTVGSIKDGTAMCTVAQETLSSNRELVMLGDDCYSLGLRGVIVGRNSSIYNGNDGILLGYNSSINTDGNKTILIGSNSESYNPDSTIIGSNIYGSYKNELKVDGVFGQPTFFSITYNDAIDKFSPSSETILWSLPMDLAGGTTWTASTVTPYGKIIKKTGASNGTQYIADASDYFPAHSANIGNYTASKSNGATEPTWTTNQFDLINDGANITWLAMKNTGGSLFGTLPHLFVPTEFGIIVHEITSITVQPTIQLGSTLNGTDLLASTTTTKLTAVGKLEKYTITNPVATDTFGFNISTLATGTKLVCRMYVKGFFWKHWI